MKYPLAKFSDPSKMITWILHLSDKKNKTININR
jgi:hypothetical protein